MPFINGLQVIAGEVVAISDTAPLAIDGRRAGYAYADLTQLHVTNSPVVASSTYVSGVAIAANGAVHVFDASAGLPAGAVLVNGIALTSNGAICYAPNTVVNYVRGWPVDALGRVCTPPALNLPGAFNFLVPNQSGTLVYLNWTPSVYAIGYRIFRDAVLLKTVPNDILATFDEPGIGTFDYEIVAVNPAGTTASTPPNRIVNVT